MIRSNAPLRPRLQHLALAAALGLALVGLSQCRAVSDRVTGLQLSAPQTLSARANCVHQCNEQFKAAMMAEQDRFLASKRACGSDLACRKQADETHQRNLQTIIEEMQSCKRSCYTEGAGNVGA